MAGKSRFHIHHNSVLLPLLNSLRDNDIDCKLLINKSKLRNFDVEAAHGYVPSIAVYDFFEMVKDKYDLTEISKFCKNHNGVNSWGEMGNYVLSLPSLYDIVSHSVKYESNFHTNARTEFRIDGPTASLTFHYIDNPSRGRKFTAELVFAAALDEFQHILGEEWAPTSLSVQNSNLEEIEEILPSGKYEVKLNQECYAISFPSLFLTKQLENNFIPHGTKPSLLLDNTSSIAIGKILMNVNDGGIPMLNEIADCFNAKERSLERHLMHQGTSFREIREKTLFLRSLDKIENPGKSIKDISYELGYTEMSNFSRAFKRWTGKSPEQYRASLSK